MQVAFTSIESKQQFALHVGSSVVKVTLFNIGYFQSQMPPPNIDFTLPSPTIGLPSQTVVDPPWTPHFKAKIEEVTVNQEGTVSLTELQ